MDLTELGWNDHFEKEFAQWREEGLSPARVSRVRRASYTLLSEQGELEGHVAGRFRHGAWSRALFPTIGDWVTVSVVPGEAKGTISAVLPRRTQFSRKAVLAGGPQYGPGKTDEQVLAANIDTVFLVAGLDGDLNARRLERYLTITWDSGASPVIVLNKADICEDVAAAMRIAEPVGNGVPILLTSAVRGDGVDDLRPHIVTGQTVAFLGSSGVGKSTLINALLGTERQRIGPVRSYDNRGRHTTTERELIVLPGGGLLIDTPGLRVLKVWTNEEGLARTFADVEELVTQCRFRNCSHDSEPGCAIKAAIEEGTLDAKRFRNYVRMHRERQRVEICKAHWARIDGEHMMLPRKLYKRRRKQ
jgi:ribosome biogenesis GTPase